MYEGATTASLNQAYAKQDQAGRIEGASKQSPVQQHAQMLHEQAEALGNLNGRLSAFIERLAGPQPENPSEVSPPQPNPNGALLVAGFGAQRISLCIERLRELVTRAEKLA